jgi:hypothetical protein
MAFVTERAEFRSVSAQHSLVADLEQRLPQQVFRIPGATYRFIEFGVALRAAAWRLLRDLAAEVGNGSFSLMCHSPEAADYYFRHFGRFAALTYDVRADAREFVRDLNQVPDHSEPDALIHSMDVFSWTCGSTAWAAWGQRALDVVVLAVEPRLENVVSMHSHLLFPRQHVLKVLLARNFQRDQLPPGFADEFRRSYGID